MFYYVKRANGTYLFKSWDLIPTASAGLNSSSVQAQLPSSLVISTFKAESVLYRRSIQACGQILIYLVLTIQRYVWSIELISRGVRPNQLVF